MAAPRMPLAEVWVRGIDLIFLNVFIFILSALSFGVGFAVITSGGDQLLGLILIVFGVLSLMTGSAGMGIKIIADGVSWGVHANSGEYTKSKSGKAWNGILTFEEQSKLAAEKAAAAEAEWRIAEDEKAAAHKAKWEKKIDAAKKAEQERLAEEAKKAEQEANAKSESPNA